MPVFCHRGAALDHKIEEYVIHLFNPANRESVIEDCLVIADSCMDSSGSKTLRNRWQLTRDLYSGLLPGYKACNTEYHDFNHTCDVLCATIRMCDGALSQGVEFEQSLMLDIITAAMLHDAGYIQETGDETGTGAKYTKTHVTRSIAFTERERGAFNISQGSSIRIGRLISGTDLAVNFPGIPFTDDTERFAGQLLASADLLGQMADRTYLEKLLFLYYEFKEAGFPGYDTEFDILRKTLGFYEMTRNRLFITLGNVSVMALHHFASRYGIEKNIYMESIERQIEYLETIIKDDTVNFRKKLKRIDLEAVSNSHRHIEAPAQ